MDVRALARTIAKDLSRHSPAILTGMGVAGFVTTIVMTAKASPDAMDIHNDEVAIRKRADRDYENKTISEEERDRYKKESYLEEAKSLAPLCLPPLIVGTASITCFLLSGKVRSDRHAALLAAYSMSTETLARYQDKVIEKFGEESHRDILNDATVEMARDNVPDGYIAETEVIPMNKVRVYDTVTGRYFYSNKEAIYEAESEINQMLIDQVIVKHQEFYYLLGLEESYSLGESMGWDVGSGRGVGALKVWLSPHLDDDKNPCLAMSYHVLIFDRSA